MMNETVVVAKRGLAAKKGRERGNGGEREQAEAVAKGPVKGDLWCARRGNQMTTRSGHRCRHGCGMWATCDPGHEKGIGAFAWGGSLVMRKLLGRVRLKRLGLLSEHGRHQIQQKSSKETSVAMR
jgi:hypothetical protein